MEVLARKMMDEKLQIVGDKSIDSIRILTVVRRSNCIESASQTSGTDGSDEGVETSTLGDSDNSLTGHERSGSQEDGCEGFDELHSVGIQLKQQK
jgi:hypothetical protein